MKLSLTIALPLLLAVLAPQLLAQPSIADARRLYDQTDYHGALNLLQKMPPQNGAVRELSGRCRYFLGDYKAAIDDLEKAVQLEPRSSDHSMWLGRAWGRRAENSVFFMAVKYASETRKDFEKAVELNPGNLEAVSDLLSFYLDAPGFLGGGVEPATKLTELIRKADPVEYQCALAQISIHRKDYDAAERQFRKAVEMAPRRVNRLVDLAKFLSVRGKLRESDAVFDQAAAIDANDKRLLYGRAEAYIKGKRNLSAARKYLEAYLQAPLTPDDPSRDEARKLMRRAASGGGSGD
ncbi:MAG: tetratricopeptide repeat protein [Bryobacteraceae bacterium]|nr:tetratricopeptide repeat protein [Bryobacteraceae bacterium]